MSLYWVARCTSQYNVRVFGIGFAVCCDLFYQHFSMRVWDVGRMGWERKTRVTQQQQAEGVRSPDKIKGSKIEVQVVLSNSCRERDGPESSYET